MDLLRRGIPQSQAASHPRNSALIMPNTRNNQRPGEIPRHTPLSFPSTRAVLWDQRPKGQPTNIHLSEYRNPSLILEEKTLWLMQRFAAQDINSDVFKCMFIGSAGSETDGEGIRISLDRMDPNVTSKSQEGMDGELLVTCCMKKNANRSIMSSAENYSHDVMTLCEHASLKEKIDLVKFLQLRAYCSYHPNQQNHIFHLDLDLVTIAKTFRATPINPVPIVPTALSKNLSGPMSLSDLQGEPKTGYLTMDHTRKLVLVLESDPKVTKLPLIGVWLSGIHNIHDPFVWASCVRYLYNNTLQDRVCLPPECFLIVLYSPLHSQPEFYNCITSDGKVDFKCSLSTCHEVITLPKDSPVRPRSPLELELLKVEDGPKLEMFEAALYENANLMATQSSKKPGLSTELSGSMEEIVPRTSPAPHYSKGLVSLVRPSVPEVSILFDEKDQGNPMQSSQSQPHPYPGLRLPQPNGLPKQPPYPAAFKEKKSKKKKADPNRGPLRTVNGAPGGLYDPSSPVGYNQSPGTWPSQATHTNSPVYPSPGQYNSPYMQHPGVLPHQQQGTPQYYYQSQGPVAVYQTGAMSSGQPIYPPNASPAYVQPQPYMNTQPQLQARLPGPQQYAPSSSLPSQQHYNQGLCNPQTFSSSPGLIANQPHGTLGHPYGMTPPLSVAQNQRLVTPTQQLPMSQAPVTITTPSHPLPSSQQQMQQNVANHSQRQEGVSQSNSFVEQQGGHSSQTSAPSTPELRQPAPPNTSPESHVSGMNSSEVPPHVYELLRQQDTQLKALREQLEQLILSKKDQGEESIGPRKSSHVEMMSTATQSSAKSSPVKKKNEVCEMAVNTSLRWNQGVDPWERSDLPNQSKQSYSFNHSHNKSHESYSSNQDRYQGGQKQVLNMNSSVQQSDISRRNNSFHNQDNLSLISNQNHQQSHNSSRQVNQPVLNQNRQSQASQSHTQYSPPRHDSDVRSSGRDVGEHANNTLSNDTCSLSELQLQNLHDRTEDSYISMVVDMPGYHSMSPEKSPHGGSSGFGDTDDSNRSPVLGESVSMYERNLDDSRVLNQAINQSEDTGLGDSNPQVSLLYRNQHQFYNNLLGNVQKFLANNSANAADDSQTAHDDEEIPPDQQNTPSSPPRKPDVEMSIDVAAQTRQQLKKLGIDLEDLGTSNEITRNNVSTYFDPFLLPKVNYISMMLDSDSDMSADADALAMKYLSDEQLSELAKMRMKSPNTKQRRDPALNRLITRCKVEESTYMGPNHLSFASKKYMERYGLLDMGERPTETEIKQVDPLPIERVDEYQASDQSTTDPAILNAKAFLKRLQESSFLNGNKQNVGDEGPHLDQSFPSLQNNSGRRQAERREGGSRGSSFSSSNPPHHHHHLSVASDNTQYHSSSRKQGYSQHSDSDRGANSSASSVHSAPDSPCVVRVLNNSQQINGQNPQREYHGRREESGGSGKSQPHGRILDIQRLKDLPKLL